MKSINISDGAQRDAFVGVERKPPAPRVVYVDEAGRPARRLRYIRSTRETRWQKILERAGSPAAAARLLADEDPEIDFTLTGKKIERTRRVFLEADGAVAYSMRWQDVLYDPAGRESGRREHVDREANINGEIPLRWTGRFISKADALRTFVTRRIYQLKHVNGLTFEFLFEMARRLDEKGALMALGGGRDGSEPLVLVRGGLAYRAFLEGRVHGDEYMLLLHLSNLEVKEGP